jgi:hypothetical protein
VKVWLDFRRKQHTKKQEIKKDSCHFHGYEHFRDDRILVLIENDCISITGNIYQDSFNTAEEVYSFIYPNMRPNAWLTPYFYEVRIHRDDGETCTFARDQTLTREENLARLEEMLFKENINAR